MTPEEYCPIPPTKIQKAVICIPEEVQTWKDKNQKFKKRIVELEADLEATEERIREYEAHENQTHEILGKILGTDNTLENVARRAISKITELEKKNAVLEAQIAALQKIAITEKAYHIYYRCQGDCGRCVCSAGAHKKDARRQLAEEHPEAFR